MTKGLNKRLIFLIIFGVAVAIVLMLLSGIVFSLLVITFIYMVYSIGHLAKRHHVLAQFLAVIAGLVIYKAAGSLIIGLMHSDGFLLPYYGSDYFDLMPLKLAKDAVLSALCGTITYLVLKFRLNLE